VLGGVIIFSRVIRRFGQDVLHARIVVGRVQLTESVDGLLNHGFDLSVS
jgi:hypothetical protein